MKHPETELQIACVKWFTLQYPKIADALHCLVADGKKTAVAARIDKARGLRRGYPDLCLFVKGAFGCLLFIELKAGKGFLTEIQAERHYQLRYEGYRVEIVRSLPEFIELVTFHLETKL